MTIAIECEHVNFQYPIGFLGRTSQLFNYSDPERNFEALRDVHFSVNIGDRVGILGLNGAGKTTLLRVLSGALKPSSGRVQTIGRVQSLLSSSSGTIAERSGMENIYLRGYALGLNKTDVESQIDGILEFAELDEFIHHPMRTYSSGMSLRLMFGVSTAFPPDILIMDEWIGVGDKAFQQRALKRMSDFVGQSGTLIVASHSRGIILNQCNKGLILEDGAVLKYGEVHEVYEFYEQKDVAK